MMMSRAAREEEAAVGKGGEVVGKRGEAGERAVGGGRWWSGWLWSEWPYAPAAAAADDHPSELPAQSDDPNDARTSLKEGSLYLLIH